MMRDVVRQPGIPRSLGLLPGLAAFFLVGGLVAAAIFGLVADRGDKARTTATSDDVSDGVDAHVIPDGEPCGRATKLKVDELKNRAKGVTVRWPDERQAGVRMTGARLCGGNASEPVVVLDETIWVFYEAGYPQQGRDEWLQALAAEYGGQFTSFDGANAVVDPSEEDGVRSQIIVGVPDSDEIIRIQAPYGVAMDDLEAVAASFGLSNGNGSEAASPTSE